MDVSRLDEIPRGVDLLLFDRLSGSALVNAILELNRYQTPLQRENSGLNKYLVERILRDFIGEIESDDSEDFTEFIRYILGWTEFEYEPYDNLGLDPLLIYSVFSSILENANFNIQDENVEDIKNEMKRSHADESLELINYFITNSVLNLNDVELSKLFMALLMTHNPKKIFKQLAYWIGRDRIDSILKNIINFSSQSVVGEMVTGQLLKMLLNDPRFAINIQNSNELINLIIDKYLCTNAINPIKFLRYFSELHN